MRVILGFLFRTGALLVFYLFSWQTNRYFILLTNTSRWIVFGLIPVKNRPYFFVLNSLLSWLFSRFFGILVAITFYLVQTFWKTRFFLPLIILKGLDYKLFEDFWMLMGKVVVMSQALSQVYILYSDLFLDVLDLRLNCGRQHQTIYSKSFVIKIIFLWYDKHG